jgi:hypothetical protein
MTRADRTMSPEDGDGLRQAIPSEARNEPKTTDPLPHEPVSYAFQINGSLTEPTYPISPWVCASMEADQHDLAVRLANGQLVIVKPRRKG